jgi:oligopeptide transport system substrate-binding protein
VTITFDAKGGSAVAPVTVAKNGSVAAPTAPTRAGYTFGGWFRGRPGLTWLEPSETTFPLTASTNTTFYAYWEPINSKAVNYSSSETYFSTLSSTAQAFVLNPMTYKSGAEINIMSSLSTSLYSSEVDWEKAISQGVADFVGDFSKIENKEYSIEALDFINILQGAKSFPKDADGNDYTLPGGKYDRENASKNVEFEWFFELRDDIFFEDGLQVTAQTVEYTLKQFLDPVQNNDRSQNYYKDEDNKAGLPIFNASQYRKQTIDNPVSWSSVGFKVLDTFKFKLVTFEEISQAQAVGFGSMILVHPTIFEASLNGGNSTYGTPLNPFVSYGPYLIKSWDENQKLVLNKNFNFVKRETITYKSISYSFTSSVEENMNLFDEGLLSSVGLIGQYYAQYAESENIKRAFQGYPSYLAVNVAPSKLSTNPHQKHPIVQDEKFRQALFFGFNRVAFTNTVFAPNAPSVLPVPIDTRSYIQDPLYYSESPNHLQNLFDAGITAGTNGYIPEKAKQLFNEAYAAYLLTPGAVAGPVTLKYIITNDTLQISLANYVKAMYETLFNTNPATPDKLIIDIVAQTAESHEQTAADWDFDIMPINLGFNSSSGVWWQYAAFTILVGAVAPQFGLNMPFSMGTGGQRTYQLTASGVQGQFTLTKDSAIVTNGDTTGIKVDDLIFGSSVPAGAKVKAIVDATSFEMDKPVTANLTTPTVRTLTIGTRGIVTGDTTNLIKGQIITGTGVVANTRINSIIDSNTMELTLPVLTSGTQTLSINPTVDLRNDPNSWLSEVVDIDLTTTFEYLEEIGVENLTVSFKWLFDKLVASNGKAEGIYRGPLFEIAGYVYNEVTPWDAPSSEPFSGAREDTWRITAALEKAFLKALPLIPYGTLDSAVLYADNVKILWPAYSVAFGWGANRYRYLTTDSDFANGFYNSFEVAYLASLPA